MKASLDVIFVGVFLQAGSSEPRLAEVEKEVELVILAMFRAKENKGNVLLTAVVILVWLSQILLVL